MSKFKEELECVRALRGPSLFPGPFDQPKKRERRPSYVEGPFGDGDLPPRGSNDYIVLVSLLTGDGALAEELRKTWGKLSPEALAQIEADGERYDATE